MNKLLSAILLIFLTLSLSGCKDDFNPLGKLRPSLSAHYLHSSETNFTIDTSSPFSFDFEVVSFETSWNFSEVADWISLSPSSGDTSSPVKLEGKENLMADFDRTSIFYLRSDDPVWDWSRPITVSQASAAPFLLLDETELDFSGSAGYRSVKVEANCKWEVVCDKSWVNVSSDRSSGLLGVAVQSNPLPSYRNADVLINYGDDKKAYLRIKQAPAGITSSSYTLEYENVAARYDVVIESETEWDAVASESWISVSPEKGEAGKTVVSIEVTPNTSVAVRNGYVAFFTGDAERLQIKVIQKGLYIEADNELSFDSSASSLPLSIVSNTSWSVLSRPVWVSLSKESGNGSMEINVSVEENISSFSRSGDIVFSHPGLSLECRVKVIQSGKRFSTDISHLEFSEKGGVLQFNILSDSYWVSKCSADWFAVSPDSGSGDMVVTVSATPNNSTEERNGILSYTYADGNSQVAVHQFSRYITVDNELFEFGSHGGSHLLELSTNENWNARVEHDVDWLHLSSESGSGSMIITITADDNPSVNSRSTAIVIDTEFSQDVRILVSQLPRHLSLSSQSVLFFSSGGVSEPIIIDTDGTYRIDSDSDWFEVNNGPGDTFTVIATPNPDSSQRKGVVTVSLDDLQKGSLSLSINVLQAGQGGSFILSGYTEDRDWSGYISGNISLSIKGYSSDQNWDAAGDSSISIKVEGFSSDEDWDDGDGASGKIKVYPYGPDIDWNHNKNNISPSNINSSDSLIF